MEKGITKRERNYILFNIREFFKHYKIEQNINKITIDISNLQKMREDVNNKINDLKQYYEEVNSNILFDNQANRTKLLVNRRHKFITKSTDTATKKIVENKQKTKLKDLKYELDKSNLTLRPKTPDVSQIFNKYKKKKYNTNIGIKSNYNNMKNNIKIGSKSFIQPKKFLTKYNGNNISNINNVNKVNTMNKSNNNIDFDYNSIYNKTHYKSKRDNSIDNKDNDYKSFNNTMTRLPTEYDAKNRKNIKQLNSNNNNLEKKDLSPYNKIILKKDNNIKGVNKIQKNKNLNINTKEMKYKKIKRFNINNKFLTERFHSSDISKRKLNNESNKNQNNQNIKININKKVNKKMFKFNLNRRMNVKTPSPINYRQSSPLLIDHDTIIRNKNKKINYNGNYYNEHLISNKVIQKKISTHNTNKKKRSENNDKHLKLKSNELIRKDISKEEEKKLDEQIINTTVNNTHIYNIQNDGEINNTKNLMDLSQHLLNNLDINHDDLINKSGSNNNINFSNINNNNNNNSNKKIYCISKKNSYNLFVSNYIESLYLSIKLGFFPPWEKLKLLLISKELYFKFNLKEIIHDYINYYNKQIQLINNEINKYEINIINKPFTPRKTGLNSLNFITKNEEHRLINEKQHDYVIKIFKIILILLNEYNNYINIYKENINENENTKIFEFLFNDIYNKNNVTNIKDLFINYFVDKVPLVSDSQFNMINDIIKEIPELLSPSTLLAYNRNVSYLTFFLSELYNYLTLKTKDDIYYYKIRNKYAQLSQYINKINKLKIYLS